MFSPGDSFAILNIHTLFRRDILQNYWYSSLTIRTFWNKNITNEAEWRRRNVRAQRWIIVWNFQIALLLELELETLMSEPEHQWSKLGKYKLVCCLSCCWITQQFILSCADSDIILLWIVWAHLGLLKYYFGFGREVITDLIPDLHLCLQAPVCLASNHIICILSELFCPWCLLSNK